MFNPATGEQLAEVADASEEDVRREVDAAAEAFHPWEAQTADACSRLLRRSYELMLEQKKIWRKR